MSEIRAEHMAEKLRAFEKWADRVKPEDLKEADPEASRQIVKALEGDPEIDRIIDEARRAALREERESA